MTAIMRAEQTEIIAGLNHQSSNCNGTARHLEQTAEWAEKLSEILSNIQFLRGVPVAVPVKERREIFHIMFKEIAKVRKEEREKIIAGLSKEQVVYIVELGILLSILKKN